MAAIAGAIAALGHAPFGLWPVSLLGFGALAYIMAAPISTPQSALSGWAGGVGYFVVTLNWIVEPFLVDIARHGWLAPIALVLTTAGMALFWGLAGAITARIGGHRAIGWAVALTAGEMVRAHVFTGFPWALPGYIWVDTWFRLSASFFGPFGLTLLTLLLVALPLAFHRIWIGFGSASAILIVLVFASSQVLPMDAKIGTVRLVQPNAPQDQKWDPDKAHIFVERQIEFTAAPDTRQFSPDLIIWPETAIPYRLDRAGPVLAQIASAARGVPVITGINRSEGGRNHNSLISIGPNGQPTDVYDKVHLVPYGEYIPFGRAARFVGLSSLAAGDGYGFSPGEGVRLIDTPLGRALPLICYEAIFPQHGRALTERPDYLLQITNDAWFGTFSGPYQHLDQARFRAVEQGLPLVRAANTGISAVIGPEGNVLQSLALGEAGFLDAAMPAPFPPTFYARTGDWPTLLVLIAMLTALYLTQPRNTIAMSRGTE